jgi:hypothetical protein
MESPLLVAVAAGSVALPTLLKLADILVTQGQELAMDEGCLPVEVELGTVSPLPDPPITQQYPSRTFSSRSDTSLTLV